MTKFVVKYASNIPVSAISFSLLIVINKVFIFLFFISKKSLIKVYVLHNEFYSQTEIQSMKFSETGVVAVSFGNLMQNYLKENQTYKRVWWQKSKNKDNVHALRFLASTWTLKYFWK